MPEKQNTSSGVYSLFVANVLPQAQSIQACGPVFFFLSTTFTIKMKFMCENLRSFLCIGFMLNLWL